MDGGIRGVERGGMEWPKAFPPMLSVLITIRELVSTVLMFRTWNGY